MKNTFLLGALMSSALLCTQASATDSATATDFVFFQEKSPSHLFVNKDGSLTSHVITLLTLDGLYEEGMVLSQAVEKTQRAWIGVVQGKNMKERSDLIDSEARSRIRDKVVTCATEMGLFAEKRPLLTHYTYGVWHGAFLDGVRRNLRHLVDAWNRGIRFDTLVVLTGERDLRKMAGEQDEVSKLCDQRQSPLPFKQGWKLPSEAPYNTEYDMIKIVFDQIQLPEGMASALQNRVVFVNASREGSARPSTKDTFRTWIAEYHPEPGTILASSYPLLWAHQALAGESALKGHPFCLDTIAPALSERERLLHEARIVSLVFDTVAKCLFELSLSR